MKKNAPARGCEGFLTFGVDPDAENTGADSGEGGRPPPVSH